MFNQAIFSVFSLLLGFGILLIGNGLLGTLLGIRASIEQFPEIITGLLMSAYFVGFILGSLYSHKLIRQVGHIRTFAAMAAICAAAMITHGLLVNPWLWAVLRILTGACLAGLYTIIESWLNERASNEIRGRILGVYTSVSLLSLTLGQFVIVIARPDELTLFALGAVLFTLGLVPIALTKVKEPVLEPPQFVRLSEVFKISPLGVIGVLTSGLVNGAFFGMGAVFAHSIGLSTFGIALFMSSVILGGAFLQVPIGHASDRIDRRLVIFYVNFAGAIVAISAFLLLHFERHPLLALTAISFLYGGHVLTLYSVSFAHVGDHVERTRVLETTSVLLLVYGVGAATGPFLAGILMSTAGPRILPAYFATVLGITSLYSLYRMSRRSAVPDDQKDPFIAMTRTSDVILNFYPDAIEQAEDSRVQSESN